MPTDNHLNRYLDAEAQKRDAEAQQFSLHQRVRHHLRKMAGLSLGEKFGYIFNKAVRRGQADAAREAPVIEQHPRGQKDYPVTLMGHRLKPYGGTVTLLIDEESSPLYGKLGWENISLGRLETHVMPGTHLTYIRENSAAVAAKFRELLQPSAAPFQHAPTTA